MSKIFFPLRSNSAWFLKHETQNALEMRIKMCLILYDEVVFQDALYKCTIWENGSFDMHLPPESIGFDRMQIQYFNPGENAALYIGRNGSDPAHQLIGGRAQVSYHVDYFPIINKAGLFNADYIKFISIDANQKGKNRAKQEAERDAGSPELVEILNDNSFYRKKILESLYIDSLLSLHVEAPFVVDYNVGPTIRWKYKKALQIHGGAIRDIFFDNWISLGLPNFGEASWEEVDKIRQSSAGVELRKMLERIVIEISDALPNLEDVKDITIIVERAFTKKLLSELLSKIPSSKETLFNLGLNLLPSGVGSFAGGIKDVANLALSKRSWVSLLRPKK